MAAPVARTAIQIKKALASAKRQKPVYAGILNYYEQIFLAQKDTEKVIRLDSIDIDKKKLRDSAKNRRPLIHITDFKIDIKATEALLKKICTIGQDANEDMARSCRALLEAFDTGKVDMASLCKTLVNGDDAFLIHKPDALGIDPRILAFVTHSSIAPSLTVAVKQLASHLKKAPPWNKGTCPVCGGLPGLAMLKNGKERRLFCSFCWHEWPIQRYHCPFCGNQDAKTLFHLFSEEEREHRIDVCQKCTKYIKTVNTALTKRLIYPPLEQICTLHLDIKARGKGYESGVPV